MSTLAAEYPDLVPLIRRPEPADPCAGFESEPSLPLRTGDRLHVHVDGEPSLSEEIVVPATGSWYFVYGKVHLDELTLGALTLELTRRLLNYGLREVLVHCHRAPPFYPTQGRLEVHSAKGVKEIYFTKQISLVSILSTEFPAGADWRQVVVVRTIADPVVFVCDLWLYFAYARVEQDLPLRHGDVVLFPRVASDWSRVRAILAR